MVEQDVRGALASLLSDDEFVELLTEAEGQDDTEGYLRRKYRELMRTAPRGKQAADGDTPTQSPVESKLTKYGLSVVENYIRRADREGLPRPHRHGFSVMHQSESGTFYCGRSQAWLITPEILNPFETQESATLFALSYTETLAQRERIASVPIKFITAKVPLAVGVRTKEPKAIQIQYRLTPDESHRIEALRTALRFLNVELEPGKPVDSYADCFRFLVAQLPIL